MRNTHRRYIVMTNQLFKSISVIFSLPKSSNLIVPKRTGQMQDICDSIYNSPIHSSEISQKYPFIFVCHPTIIIWIWCVKKKRFNLQLKQYLWAVVYSKQSFQIWFEFRVKTKFLNKILYISKKIEFRNKKGYHIIISSE